MRNGTFDSQFGVAGWQRDRNHILSYLKEREKNKLQVTKSHENKLKLRIYSKNAKKKKRAQSNSGPPATCVTVCHEPWLNFCFPDRRSPIIPIRDAPAMLSKSDQDPRVQCSSLSSLMLNEQTTCCQKTFCPSHCQLAHTSCEQPRQESQTFCEKERFSFGPNARQHFTRHVSSSSEPAYFFPGFSNVDYNFETKEEL